MGDSAHTTHHTNPGGKSATTIFFPEMRFFLKTKSASMIATEIKVSG
jgi:hypothetical protein